jgi:hypothetical protein
MSHNIEPHLTTVITPYIDPLLEVFCSPGPSPFFNRLWRKAANMTPDVERYAMEHEGHRVAYTTLYRFAEHVAHDLNIGESSVQRLVLDRYGVDRIEDIDLKKIEDAMNFMIDMLQKDARSN